MDIKSFWEEGVRHGISYLDELKKENGPSKADFWQGSDSKLASDSIQSNLEKLERLVPGTKITMPTGEGWQLLQLGTGTHYAWKGKDLPNLHETPGLRPLLASAVQGGASVVLPEGE